MILDRLPWGVTTILNGINEIRIRSTKDKRSQPRLAYVDQSEPLGSYVHPSYFEFTVNNLEKPQESCKR